MKLLSAAVLYAVLAFIESAAASVRDLRRAKTKVPGQSFRGSSFALASQKLNKALERSSASSILAPCHELSVSQLQETMKALLEMRDVELSKIYDATNDARALRHSSLAGYHEEWALMAKVASSSELALAAHDMLCHEAVMVYVHHLTTDEQSILADERVVFLPKLPVGERLFASRSRDALVPDARIVVDAYLQSTGCAACHTDMDGLEPEIPSAKDAPKWPPAAEPVLPWRWSANLGGWMMMGPERTDFTGSFHYDYTLNRLKEHWVVASMGMEIINYWFGAPGPDGEATTDLPDGARRGHIYQVMKMGDRVLSCKDDTYSTFSVVRPDAFIKQWHNDPDNLHYVARENLALEDMGGAAGWADHWTYADSCGNFSLWISLESGLPLYTRGPTGCNSGDAGNSYLNHTLVAPAEALFEFNFSACAPRNESNGLRRPMWGSPSEAILLASVV